MRGNPSLVIRWTIGNVSHFGFDALRLSIWGARKLFGPSAAYVVCVNSIRVDKARELTGEIPDGIEWRDNSREIPDFIREHLDGGLVEGVGWRFAPVRLFPNTYELALDNDCILWEMPGALRGWTTGDWCVIAEDVAPYFGKFAHLCPRRPRNSGIRGLTPSFDYERALRSILAEQPIHIEWENDEQGLQTAALYRNNKPRVVRVEEVTICSPFPPHHTELGRCGAHFAGLNAKLSPWRNQGRPASEFVHEHFVSLTDEINRRIFG